MDQADRSRLSPRALLWLGAGLALLIAVVLFSRWSIDDRLTRDESIYAYGGQQLAAGVPPYVSIVDPKTPLATFLSGGAVTIGRAVQVDDVVAIRYAFFLFACLAVVAVFLACALLYESVLAGLFGAASLAAFETFARDALGGPNPKTPAVLLAALATALLLKRQWFWGGLVSALAMLIWQPLIIYVVVAAAAAYLGAERSDRLRALAAAGAGAAIPVLAVLVYFVLAGAFAELFENAFLLPATGTVRRERTLVEHLVHIVDMIQRGFGIGALLFWFGLLAMAVLIGVRLWRAWHDLRALGHEPLVILVLPPLAFFVAFSIVDFQGYDDAFPLMLYAAMGVAGVAAAAELPLRDTTGLVRFAPATVLAVLVAATLWWYIQPREEGHELSQQRRDAAAVDALLGPGGRLYALGDPSLLVLTNRTNPSPNIFLSAGVDQWVVRHTPGGFTGWTRRIEESGPDAVYLNAWITQLPYRDRMLAWLRQRYEQIEIGDVRLFVTPQLVEEANRPAGALLLR